MGVLAVATGLVMGSPTSSNASEEAELCPIRAGVQATAIDKYDANIWTSNPVTNLVGCARPFFPPMAAGGATQVMQDIALDFGPVPESAFVGNTFKIRLLGTYGNYGYTVNIWTDKGTTSTEPTSATYVSRYRLAFRVGYFATVGTEQQEFSVTVTDPQKAKILEGDFVVQVNVVGGATANQEGVNSISIPCTRSDAETETAPTSQSPQKMEAVDPAIHLDLQAVVGGSVSESPILMEGQGLQRSSSYTLRLSPGGQVLKSGTVSRDGRFSHSISLPPGMAPGRYFVELTAVGGDGKSLVLKQFFTVGANGILTSIEPGIPGNASSENLAFTGPNENTWWLAVGSLGLVVAGFTMVISAGRRRRRSLAAR